jgi:nucleotide-binding universal stress UspA family protein
MRVLVPVEDPLFAACMAYFIKNHAWPSGTEFIVMHIIEPYLLDDSPHITFAPLLEISRQEVIADASRLVAAMAQSINNAHPTATVTQDVVQAHVVEQIKHFAKTWNPDLVILGSHGRSGFQHFMLGSVSLELCSELTLPLLLIKPQLPMLKKWDDLSFPSLAHASFEKALQQLETNQKLKKIVLALDNTSLNKQLVQFCLDHTWKIGTELELFSTVDERPFFFLPPPLKDKLAEILILDRKRDLTEMSHALFKKFMSEHVAVNVQWGTPRTHILDRCKQDADILVLGNHLQKGRLGGTALSCLCAAQCSVLLLKEDMNLTKSEIDQHVSTARKA